MVALWENQKTLRIISLMINEIDMRGVTVYFVTSYPRSDMGKGTFIAQLLNVVEDSDAIKFDGILNTNINGHHTAKGYGDFGVYEQFNPKRSFSDEHYLIGGEILLNFIKQFGENEHLQITPHLSLYVEYLLMKMWKDIGSPKNLFVEIGGVFKDNEVAPIFQSIINHFIKRKNGRVILLSEFSYNGEYVKTKTVQDGIKMLQNYGIEPWLILARETKEMGMVSLSERLGFERILLSKIGQNFSQDFVNVISVPFFENLNDYTKYVARRFLPLVQNTQENKKIFFASRNRAKIKDVELYLGDEYQILTPYDFEDKSIDIVEGIASIQENAFAKARSYAVSTGLLTLADDTGFFIHELMGEPGVAVRRWGGELPEKASPEEFWEYLKQKTACLNEINCHFERCFCVVSPSGKYDFVFRKKEGVLNKEKLKRPYNGSGYPLGAAFEPKNQEATWDEMSDEQKKEFDKKLISDLKTALKNLIK